MAKALTVLFLISTLSLGFFHLPIVAAEADFDLFVLALQWLPTICRTSTKCCSINACCRMRPSMFTIFGLNPATNHGTTPEFCGCGFNETKIESLLPDLNVYWPTLSCNSLPICDGYTKSMFAHSWVKRGTCAYPVLKEETSFFSKALDLYHTYDVTAILRNAGISSSNAVQYKSSDIVSAIEEAVGASPELKCKDGYVWHVYICFTKDFVPRNCPGVESSSGCSEYVTLPQSPSAMAHAADQENLKPFAIV